MTNRATEQQSSRTTQQQIDIQTTEQQIHLYIIRMTDRTTEG